MTTDAPLSSASPPDHKPRRTQVERRETTRTKLLQAAIEVIAEVGYERASIAEIGRRAGYSRGIVTHTFGSKSGLLEAVVDHMHTRWSVDSLNPAVQDATGADAMIITLQKVLQQVRDNPAEASAFYRLLFDATGPMPELRPLMLTLHKQIRKRIAQWLRSANGDQPQGSGLNPDAHSALFLSVIRGAVYQWILDPEHFDIAATLSAYEQMLKAQVAAPAQA